MLIIVNNLIFGKLIATAYKPSPRRVDFEISPSFDPVPPRAAFCRNSAHRADFCAFLSTLFRRPR